MTTQNEYSVFLVDDDKMFLASLKNDLKQKFGQGVKVSEYDTGEECIDHINQFYSLDNVPDIVILDYNLNDSIHPDAIDGIKVLKKLKSMSDDIIVIMLSGQDKIQVAVESVKNGAYEYIAKSENTLFNTENALKKAMGKIKSIRENDKYLKWNQYVGMFIFSIIVFDVIRYCVIR